MRLAVLADIHGNVRALRAVMDDLKDVAPDSVINLGDCVSGPLEAAETTDLLISLAWTTVRGNPGAIYAGEKRSWSREPVAA